MQELLCAFLYTCITHQTFGIFHGFQSIHLTMPGIVRCISTLEAVEEPAVGPPLDTPGFAAQHTLQNNVAVRTVSCSGPSLRTPEPRESMAVSSLHKLKTPKSFLIVQWRNCAAALSLHCLLSMHLRSYSSFPSMCSQLLLCHPFIHLCGTALSHSLHSEIIPPQRSVLAAAQSCVRSTRCLWPLEGAVERPKVPFLQPCPTGGFDCLRDQHYDTKSH